MLVQRNIRPTPRLGLLAGAIVLTTFVSPATAVENVGDAAAGRHLAETWCSHCHIIDRTEKTGASTGAPPFAAVAQMKSATPLSLRVFLQTPHQRMPDLQLSRVETDDLIAYILSLRDR